MAQNRQPPTSPSNTSDRADPVTRWARSVVAGQVVAGPHVRNAARRHLRDLERGPKRGLVWDLPAALHAIGFFPDVLRLNGGKFEGIPFELHLSQKFIIGSAFGWKRKNGRRRFRRIYVETGKGSGKSPLLAGVGMYCLLADKEARAEVYAFASKKDQAQVLFRDAVAMRDQSPRLAGRLTASGGRGAEWNLADIQTGSFFRPIASADGQSGPRPHCALGDEIHEHADALTLDMMERGFKWREQPMLWMATNAGSDRNSVCWREHEHACNVAAGTKSPDADFTFVGEVIDDDTFSFVCALDRFDNPLRDPKCWVKANPLLGLTVQRDYLAGVVRQARAIPGKLNGILRLHFCKWTDAAEAWMSRETLEECLAEFDPGQHAGADAYLGADLSGSQDLTALATVVPTGLVDVTKPDGNVVRLPTFDAWVDVWTPRDTMEERSLRDKMPYDLWCEEGFLHAEDGKIIRLDFVAARIAELASELRVRLLAYDRYAYRRLEEELAALGVSVPQAEHPQGGKRRAAATPEQVAEAKRRGVDPPQGLWMPGSLNELEKLFLEGRIRILRNPVVVSAIMSATTEADPFDNRWFSKRRAVNRIDAIVALAMAVGAAMSQLVVDAPSPYEERGILVI